MEIVCQDFFPRLAASSSARPNFSSFTYVVEIGPSITKVSEHPTGFSYIYFSDTESLYLNFLIKCRQRSGGVMIIVKMKTRLGTLTKRILHRFINCFTWHFLPLRVRLPFCLWMRDIEGQWKGEVTDEMNVE